MKKHFSIFLLVLIAFTVITCTDRTVEVSTTDTYPKMRDITGSFNAANQYTITQGIEIADTDVVLVYRQSGSDNGTAIWELIPRTLFLPEGELDYDFDFTKNDVLLKVGGTIDFSKVGTTFIADFLSDQRFRIVLVPASSAKNSTLKYDDYNSVAKFYNLPVRD
jgi:hypothetical protein